MSFFSEYKTVNYLIRKKYQVVFYSESGHYFQVFQPIMDELIKRNVRICYITSDPKDCLLEQRYSRGFEVFYIKWMLAFLFTHLNAEIVIMTMPDLGNFLYKKSTKVGSYIYIFHAAVSTHQQYRKEAFVHYDCIFCTGEYQHLELTKAERLYGYPQKDLIRYGYPLLETLKSKKKEVGEGPIVLIAPSWFNGCIFDTCIDEILEQLSFLSYKVIIRPHPEYKKRNKIRYNKISAFIKKNPKMEIDDSPDVGDSLIKADYLITDRSGIAFEYAIGIGNPVLFIETLPKEKNKNWRDIEIEPIENRIRQELGIIINLHEINKLPEKLKEIKKITHGFIEKMDLVKEMFFYNRKIGLQEGLNYILKKIKD